MFYRAAPRASAPPRASASTAFVDGGGGGAAQAAPEDALDILLDELARH
jgi:hypothetical protein|tara:strand:- start:472 stop:618 length:147 start_codon:yes stop_codon:yes gene_type:complete